MWTALPKRSTATWISTWRLSSRYFSRYSASLPKAGLRLGAAHLERALQLARSPDQAHPLAAAAAGGLDQDRIADALGLVESMGLVAQHARTGDGRQAVRTEQPASGFLRGETLENLRRRTDERQVVSADDFGEAFVLGEEPVAGVDGVAAGNDGGRDDRGRREVAVLGIGRADADGFVGELGGQALPIGFAVGHDRADAEGAAGAQDSQRRSHRGWRSGSC